MARAADGDASKLGAEIGVEAEIRTEPVVIDGRKLLPNTSARRSLESDRSPADHAAPATRTWREHFVNRLT